MKFKNQILASGTFISLAAMFALLAGCSQRPPQAAPVPLVLTAHVSAGAADASDTYSGEVHARIETALSFRVPGRLIKRVAHLGDEVKKGALLAEMDPADASATQRAIEAQLRSAESRLTLAQQAHERSSAEAKEDLVSRSELEQSDASYASAKADVDQLRAQRDLAQNQSGYTRLYADRDGIITSENADVGAVLAAGQQVFGFAVAGERDVTMDVAEDRIATIKTGQLAQVSLPTHPGVQLEAKVREVAQAADPQSRSFRVKLTLSKPQAVMPGISATVTFASASPKQFVTIPATALFHKGSEPAVWIVEPKTGVLQLRSVDVARYGPDQVVLSHGLNTGEEFVTKGVNTVIAGTVVHTTPDAVVGERT